MLNDSLTRALKIIPLVVLVWSCLTPSGCEGQSSTVVSSSLLIQVKLGPFVNCSSMTAASKQKISILIKAALATEVDARCHCGFEISKLIQGDFHCHSDIPYYPTYRLRIQSHGAYTSLQLADFVVSWVSTNPRVSDGVGTFDVDSTCPVVPNSTEDPPCSDKKESSVDVALLIGVMLAEFVVIVFGFSSVLAVVVIVWSNRQKRKRYAFMKKRNSRKRLISVQSTQSTDSHHSVVRMHSCEAYATSI